MLYDEPLSLAAIDRLRRDLLKLHADVKFMRFQLAYKRFLERETRG